MIHKFKVDIDIYGCRCHVIVSENLEKEFSTLMKRGKIPGPPIPEGGLFYGLASKGNAIKDYYIFYSKDSLNINIISHEISHIIDFILGDREVENTGEARAYLTGYMSEKILDNLIRKGIFLNKYLNQSNKKIDETCGLLRKSNEDTQGA